jgi:subtilisin-like proprotein convertase family protein
MLEANPNLGWRDVGHVIVNSARKNDPSDSFWTVYGAGHDVSENYGYGAIDAQAAVALSQTWTNVGPEIEVGTGFVDVNLTLPDNNSTGVTITMDVPDDIIVETVELILDVTIENAGDLQVSVFSPAGTESRLQNARNDGTNNLQAYKYTSFRHWDESSAGTWEVKLADRRAGPTGAGGAFWERARLRIYGREAASVCIADWDNSGTVNVFDILEYLNSYNAGAPEAELTGDSTLGIFDILEFLNQFNEGCP